MQKPDNIVKLEKLRKEVAEITENLGKTTTKEELLRSEHLPKGTRLIIFDSISRLLKLQREIIEIEKEMTNNNQMGYEFEENRLNNSIDYWDSMIESGDLSRYNRAIEDEKNSKTM